MNALFCRLRHKRLVSVLKTTSQKIYPVNVRLAAYAVARSRLKKS